MVALIDLEGKRYVELVHSEVQGNYLDMLYNIVSSKKDYINPTTDGRMSWRSVSLCMPDSGNALEIWKNMLHKFSMRRCARITRYV